MHYDAEYHDARLELRIMELEDIAATLTKAVRMLNEMAHRMTEAIHQTTDVLGGVLLALPTTAPRYLPLWPAADREHPAPTLTHPEPGAGAYTLSDTALGCTTCANCDTCESTRPHDPPPSPTTSPDTPPTLL